MAELKRRKKPAIRTRTAVRDMRIAPIKRSVDVYEHYGTIVIHLKRETGIRELKQCLVLEDGPNESEGFFIGLDLSDPDYVLTGFGKLNDSQVQTLVRLLEK